MDCRNATGLDTSENDEIEASSKGGALGPTEMDVSGALNTRWSSISYNSSSNSKHTAVKKKIVFIETTIKLVWVN